MNEQPCIIVDLDGTIADCSHRLHYVQDGNRDWPAFFDNIPGDSPILPLIDLVKTYYQAGETSVLLVSGRPDSHKSHTEEWLAKHDVPYNFLHMRKAGDNRQDAIIKKEILDVIQDDYTVLFTVDDRPQVIRMWRENGVLCLACKPEDGDTQQLPLRSPTLNVLIGPSGSGKTTWLGDTISNWQAIISSDCLREDFCGDFKDQSRNLEVFRAFHALIKTRLWSGLDVWADATHIRRKDRIETVKLAPPNASVHYWVFNRPMEDKYRDGGWRNKLDFDLIAKHENTFGSNLQDILNGDKNPNITVHDLRVV